MKKRLTKLVALAMILALALAAFALPASAGYNRGLAIDYANRHALSRNSAYANITPGITSLWGLLGGVGNCANFVSQVLVAGRIPQTPRTNHGLSATIGRNWARDTSTNHWYHNRQVLPQLLGLSSREVFVFTGTFTNVVPQRTYHVTTRRRATLLTRTAAQIQNATPAQNAQWIVNNAQRGDIIQLGDRHSVILHSVSGNTGTFSGNSTDRRNHPLNTTAAGGLVQSAAANNDAIRLIRFTITAI